MAKRRYSISRARIRSGMSKAKSALGRLEKYREAAKETMQQVVAAVEVSAASFGLGWAKGRYGEIDLAGMPLDLLTAGGLHLLGFTGLMGKDMSRHAHNFANGALAVYLSTKGLEVGANMASDASSGYAIGGVPRQRRGLPAGAPRTVYPQHMRQPAHVIG